MVFSVHHKMQYHDFSSNAVVDDDDDPHPFSLFTLSDMT